MESSFVVGSWGETIGQGCFRWWSSCTSSWSWSETWNGSALETWKTKSDEIWALDLAEVLLLERTFCLLWNRVGGTGTTFDRWKALTERTWCRRCHTAGHRGIIEKHVDNSICLHPKFVGGGVSQIHWFSHSGSIQAATKWYQLLDSPGLVMLLNLWHWHLTT